MRKALVPWVVVMVVAAGWVSSHQVSAGTPEWRLFRHGASLEVGARVVAFGERDIWAFGTRRAGEKSFGVTAARWDGDEWRDGGLPAGAGDATVDAGASSPSNLWLLGSGEDGARTVVRWDGRRWSAPSRLPAASVQKLLVLGEVEGWAFGEQSLHHTEAGWQVAELPMSVYAAGARSTEDIWVAGTVPDDDSRPLVGHYDGRKWTVTPLPQVAGASHWGLSGVTADASGVWITANISDDRAQTTRPVLIGRSADRWRVEEIAGLAGPWRDTAAALQDGRGGHWFLGTTDVSGYDPAPAHRSSAGTWTVRPVGRASGAAEFDTLTAIPGTAKLVASGRVDSTPGLFVHDTGR
ncbi:hypothetical protein [Sphaerisporangium rufum]|uniref:hypothetical protein n=1 Tax=Sphaerisporangium rufum TaxID=1381558 RepID=UPI0019500DA0|nr:hypothetical protein [Sphaerisporangium rufum]